jgi:hypothetical protein
MRFDIPIGSATERQAAAWPAGWFDASGFGRNTAAGYPDGEYHTGADLNRADGLELNVPVYASADGVVVAASGVTGWSGLMVVIEHAAAGVWTRYAHMGRIVAVKGAAVKRGEIVGYIGDYPPIGKAGDHLHFDVARIDLGKAPEDWPGRDLARLERDYIEPLAWIRANRADGPTLWTPVDAAGTRVRLTPDTSAPTNIVGVIPAGAKVPGELTADRRFVKVRAKLKSAEIGDVALAPSVYSSFDAYAAAQFMRQAIAVEPPPPPPPPTPSRRPRAIGTHPALPDLPKHREIGVHLLNAGFPDMAPYHAAKCPAYTSLDNVTAARECRATGAPVIVRKHINGPAPDARAFVQSMGLAPSDTFLVMYHNEGDSIPTDDIERRFAADEDFCEAVWDLLPNCFPLVGSWSMGTPRLEDPSVAKRFRETYGAFLNKYSDRAGLNYHCYSGRPANDYKPADVPVIAPRWFELRHLIYAYDPALGGLSRDVVCVGDESGVDVQGKGGLLGCGYTPDDFRRWIADRLGLFADYPQMYIHNIFMGFDGNKRWAGYNVRPYLDVLVECWAGRIAPSERLEERAAKAGDVRLVQFMALEAGPDGDSPLPPDWAPPAKPLGGVA